MAAVGTLKIRESGGEVAAAEEGFNGGGGGGVERAEGRAVIVFVISEEALPAMVDDLPEGMRRGGGGIGKWMA